MGDNLKWQDTNDCVPKKAPELDFLWENCIFLPQDLSTLGVDMLSYPP